MSHGAQTYTRSSSPYLLGLLAGMAALLAAAEARAAGWTVTLAAKTIEALTNSDTWGEQDMYWRVHMKPLVGSGQPVDCDTAGNHPDDDNKIDKLDWACAMTVSGGPDTRVEIKVEVYDEDSSSGDDELDLNIDHNQLGLVLLFEPRSSRLEILADPRFTPARCAPGLIKASGLGGGGDEPAEITFSLSASPASAVDGDSDGDGLTDTAEICGLDGDGDGVVDVDLPAMGADPARKDLFVEIDWMNDPSSATPHTHAPWLPALVNAWNELNVAPVSNPTIDGVTRPGGIALHVDVGTLYQGYGFDDNGDGTPELPAGGPSASGDIDLDGNGVPDIGNLGLLGAGTRVGGGPLGESALLGPRPGAPSPPATADLFAPGSSFALIKGAGFDPGRARVFHYVVFGHAYPQVQGGPAGSSGLAAPCDSGPCTDVMVTLGGFQRQTVDQNRDGTPDPPATPPPALLVGPGGLPVDGLVGDHTGTLLHELGHHLGLDHGGGDGVNWKPNYLSIMNYHWQLSGLAYDWDGDGLGEPVGLDFDGNGTIDLRRFQYSSFAGSPAMPALNEGAAPPPPVVSESAAPAPWLRLITKYTCPATPPGPPAPVIRAVPIFLPINWDCAAGASTPVDINNVNFSSGGGPEILTSFDDAARLANGGLGIHAGSGTSFADQRAMEASTQRIIEPPEHGQQLINRCRDLQRLGFDDQPPGTAIAGQYSPSITFLQDPDRTPVVIDPPGRNNVPTASPPHSLMNHARRRPAPLVFQFGELQRVISLRFGQAGLARPAGDNVRAVLEAFDENGLSMGHLVKPLPPPSTGITAPLMAAAVFPDQLIRRVELRYEQGAVGGSLWKAPLIEEPVQIDELVFCGVLAEGNIKPSFPPPPRWGAAEVALQIRSEEQSQVPGSGEPGNTVPAVAEFIGLPVLVDGTSYTTSARITRAEGAVVDLEAPATIAGGRFLYWRYGAGISLGLGLTRLPITLLRNATVTAVYDGRNLGERPGRRPVLDPRPPRRPLGPR